MFWMRSVDQRVWASHGESKWSNSASVIPPALTSDQAPHSIRVRNGISGNARLKYVMIAPWEGSPRTRAHRVQSHAESQPRESSSASCTITGGSRRSIGSRFSHSADGGGAHAAHRRVAGVEAKHWNVARFRWGALSRARGGLR